MKNNEASHPDLIYIEWLKMPAERLTSILENKAINGQLYLYRPILQATADAARHEGLAERAELLQRFADFHKHTEHHDQSDRQMDLMEVAP